MAWLRRHEPQVWERAAHVVGSYDYIAFCLTGAYSVESNWALESGFYDLNRRAWSPELLALAGVSADLLPAIFQPSDVVGGVSAEAARLTGLPAGTPVVAGTADHVGAAFAAGIKQDGDLLIKFGSAGDVLYSADRLTLDPRLYIDFHDRPGKYLLNGCMATSGSMLKWLTREFFGEDLPAAQAHGQTIYQFLDEQAEAIPPGSDGLVMLPYLLGEKTPILDPYARGVIFGLTLSTARPHLYRAALESVAFGFRHHVEVLREGGQSPRRVVASEGGARSAVWRQIAADVLGLPIGSLARDPGAALAAAFVAGMGAGVFRSWDEIDRFVVLGPVAQPDMARHGLYEPYFQIYRELYHQLKDTFRRLPRAE